MSLWSLVFNVNIQEKKKKKHLNGKNHLYHHNASVHKILTFLKSDFLRGLKQYACVCVYMLSLSSLSHCCKHTHMHNQHTRTHALQHTPHVLFLVEKDMAQWRDTPPLGGCTDHQEEMGWGVGEGGNHCHGYQGSSSSLALWVSKQEKEMKRGVLAFCCCIFRCTHKLKYCILNNVKLWTSLPSYLPRLNGQ